MSDFETGDTGTDYGHYEAGQQSSELDQLHQAQGSEADYNSQFGVYEQDHHAAESTDFSTGRHVEFDQPGGVHYESTDFTNYSHSAEVDDHVFAAEGSENSHQAAFSELDALQQKLGTAFAQGTEFRSGITGAGGAGELGPASG
ncbi:hypothetical protein [Dactylosporangium sp. NPDC051484]|uniref:hypothetical protein n=1 Tax=Dactylosporangium sp. NPDC051484 TaxID=3154942 RepID=UPI00344CB370